MRERLIREQIISQIKRLQNERQKYQQNLDHTTPLESSEILPNEEHVLFKSITY